MTSVLALGALCAFAPSAGAEEGGAVSMPGSPLTVSVGPLGQCQSSYANSGNNFFPPLGNTGDCGFFLAFPTAGNSQPNALQGKTWGFEGDAGPSLHADEAGEDYAPVSQSEVSGSGSSADPYTQTTVFQVSSGGKTYAVITETTTYVNGEPQFSSTYVVKNVASSKIYFRAIYAGDLYVNGEDVGAGVFLGGPPSLIGGQSTGSGVLGGFIESSAPALPWSFYEEGFWNSQADPRDYEGPYSEGDAGIWNDVRTTVDLPQAFNDRIEPLSLDNAAGVEWDQLRATGLKPGDEQSFSITNRAQVPAGLQISPASQTLTQGQTETLSLSALDTANQPYAGKRVLYKVDGANAQSGSVTLDASGQAQISYVGDSAGTDTIQMYVDLGGAGIQTSGDPAGVATATFLALPLTPEANSSFKIRSVHANPDGTITIVFVPAQDGTATLEVTVPTATISRKPAVAARSKRCKRNQLKIKGRCRAKTTVSGKLTASGRGGAALKLIVGPSARLRKALAKGRTVHLTAKLTYASRLGGRPTVQSFHVKVKGKKKRRHH